MTTMPPMTAPWTCFPDLESRARPDDHDDLRLWLRLQSCCNLIENELRSRLRTEFGTTLPRFDMMAQLERCPQGMKMSELSRHMMVTNGNVTGITDQLEKEGFVRRVKVATDRRSSLIRLTASGKARFAKMAAAHEQWIHDLFSEVPENDRDTLFGGLARLKQTTLRRLSNRA